MILDNRAEWRSVKSEQQRPKNRTLGTPHEVGSAAEKQFAICMVWCLPVRYDKNQIRAVPDMPYHNDKRLILVIYGIKGGRHIQQGKCSYFSFVNV